MKRFLLYLLRWQISTIILAPCIYYLHFNIVTKTIIANFIGGCIFYFIDKWILKDKEVKIVYQEPKILPEETVKQMWDYVDKTIIRKDE